MKNFTLLMIFSVLAICATAQTAVFDWQETELSEGSIMKSMAINDNSAIIAGYGNSFFKSVNNGASWDSLNLFNPEYNLIDISIKDNVGYIVTLREKLYDASPDVYTNGYILKTLDGGATWSAIDNVILGLQSDPALSPSNDLCHGLDFQSVETVNDSVAYCALRWYEYTESGNEDHSGIFKTSDGGANWINVSGDLDGNVTTSIVFNGTSGFLGGNDNLYKADASCDTLVDIYKDDYDYVSDITIVDSSEILFTTISDSVYFSDNGGDSFNKFAGIKGGWDIIKVNDSTFVVGGSTNKSYASTDNGQTWTAMGISTSIWEIAGIVNDSIYMMAKAAIYKCAVSDVVTGNYNFTIQTVGDDNLQKAYVSGDAIIVVGNDKNFYSSSDAGQSWTANELPANPEFEAFLEEVDFSVVSMDGDEGYACFNRIKFVDYPSDSEDHDIYWSGGILYTDDNWETVDNLDIAKVGKEDEDDTSINPNHDDCNGVNTSYIKYLGDDVLLLWVRWYDFSTGSQVEHSRVFKTVDGGKNWVAITSDLENHYVNDIEVSGDSLYIVGSSLFLFSDQAELTTATTDTLDFTNLYPVLDEGEDDAMYIYSIYVDGADIFVTTSADSCHFSSNGGATFSTFGNIKGSNDFYRFDQNSYILLGGEGKSMYTNDGGETWDDCYPGSTIFGIGGVYNDKLYALARESVYSNDLSNFDMLTAVTVVALDENSLSVAYNTSSVDFTSTGDAIDSYSIYSVSGQLMKTAEPNSNTFKIYNSQYMPGIYIVNSFVDGKRYINKIVLK